MITNNNEVIKKTRKSYKSPELLQKKAMIIKEKLENPEIKIVELEKKYEIDKSQVTRILQKEFSKVNNEQNETVTIAKENIKKWFELIAKRLQEMTEKDIITQSDLNLFTSTLKQQQAIISMIEWYSNNNDTRNIIPVNIQVNIKP